MFEAREKKAERQQQKKADRQAAKLKAKEAEQQPNPTCPKPSKASQKHTAGVAKRLNAMTSWQNLAVYRSCSGCTTSESCVLLSLPLQCQVRTQSHHCSCGCLSPVVILATYASRHRRHVGSMTVSASGAHQSGKHANRSQMTEASVYVLQSGARRTQVWPATHCRVSSLSRLRMPSRHAQKLCMQYILHSAAVASHAAPLYQPGHASHLALYNCML